METRSRQDLILAGMLALLLHGILFTWELPQGWISPPREPRAEEALTVKLVARKPAAEVRAGPEGPEKTKRPVKSSPRPEPAPEAGTSLRPHPEPQPAPVEEQPQPPPQKQPQSRKPEPEAGQKSQAPPASTRPPSELASTPSPEGKPAEDHLPPEATSEESEVSSQASSPPFSEALPPRYGYRREPEYPRLAVRRGYEGTVLLRVHILHDGRVEAVEIEESSGHHILDRAARKAVRTWRFTPARRGERPVASWALVPITFKLD